MDEKDESMMIWGKGHTLEGSALDRINQRRLVNCIQDKVNELVALLEMTRDHNGNYRFETSNDGRNLNVDVTFGPAEPTPVEIKLPKF